MPRDSSGAYTLPSGNPVVTGTVIESVWANDTMEDIAIQMNNVLTRDGLLGPTTQFQITDGTVSLPGLAFALATSTGFYRYSPNNVGLAIAGVLNQSWNASGSTIAGTLAVTGAASFSGGITGVVSFADGAVGAPSIAFTSEPTTGFYRPTTNNVGLAIAGVNRALFTPTVVTFTSAIAAIGNLLVAPTAGPTTITAQAIAGQSASVFLVPNGGTTGVDSFDLQADTSSYYLWGRKSTYAMLFGTASTERMRILSTGQIGINTSGAVGTRLTVREAAGDVALEAGDGTNSFYAGTVAAGAFNGNRGASGPLLWLMGGTERMRLLSTGELGIGATPSGRTLQVSAAAASAQLTSTTGTSSAFLQFHNTGGDYFVAADDSTGSVFSGGAYGMVFWAPSGVHFTWSHSGTLRMRLDSSGRLGIGAASTGSPLYVTSSATGQLLNLDSLSASGGYMAQMTSGVAKSYFGSAAQLVGGLSANDTIIRAEGSLGLTVGGTSHRIWCESTALWVGILTGTSRSSHGSGSDSLVINGSLGLSGQQMNFNPSANFEFVHRAAFGMHFYVNSGGNLSFKLLNTGFVDITNGQGFLLMGGAITRFESSEQTIPAANGTVTSVSHGGPRAPDLMQVFLRCKTAELGYSVGDMVQAYGDGSPGGYMLLTAYANATVIANTYFRTSALTPAVIHRTTGAPTAVTAANWRMVLKCHWL